MRHPDERLHELPVHHLGQPQGVDADLLKVVDGSSEPLGAAGPGEPNPDPDLHRATSGGTIRSRASRQRAARPWAGRLPIPETVQETPEQAALTNQRRPWLRPHRATAGDGLVVVGTRDGV